VERSGSWETPDGQALLAEVRRRAVRNAAHVAAATGVAMGRGLVDDVLLAAWLVLRRHHDKVLAAARPWAYLMSSAQKQVLDQIRAQQLLTNTASIRGRAREVLPSSVRPVGSTATDLATALRHEPSGADDSSSERVVRQIGRHGSHHWSAATSRKCRSSTSGSHGSAHSSSYSWNMAPTRPSPWPQSIADLFTATYVGWWEWAARRDPVLARLGLTPDQCGALVALLAGSRRYRHNGKHDSLLAAVRTATEHGRPVELFAAHRRRLAVFTGAIPQPCPPVVAADTLAMAPEPKSGDG
jgi:hypothetical protein